MRELEAEWAQAHVIAKGLQRPRAAYETATMLVDASQHAWKVLYINPQASRVTGDPPTALLTLCTHGHSAVRCRTSPAGLPA